MGKWSRQTVYIPAYNRYVDAIVDGDKIITECSCLSESFTSHLIVEHNESVDGMYKRGLYEGATVAIDVYKGV